MLLLVHDFNMADIVMPTGKKKFNQLLLSLYFSSQPKQIDTYYEWELSFCDSQFEHCLLSYECKHCIEVVISDPMFLCFDVTIYFLWRNYNDRNGCDKGQKTQIFLKTI